MAWNGSDQSSSGAPRSRGRISPKCAKGSPEDAASRGRISPKCASPVDANFCSRQGQDIRRKTSDVGGDKRQKTKDSHRSTSPLLTSHFSLLTSLSLLLALVGAALWYFLRPAPPPKSNNPTIKQSNNRQIASPPPRPARTNRVAKVEEPKPAPPPKTRPTEIGEVVNGYVLLPSGRLHKRTGVITNSIASRPKSWYEIFKHECNNTIACYLTLKPGDLVVGDVNYCTGAFKADFIESLKEPLFVSDDDTPEQAELKRDVIAARQELKDALDRGEDIEKIIQDTRSEFRRLYEMKESYNQMFLEMRKSCETEQDVEDAFNACNKALAEKGIGPIHYGPITKRNLMRERKRAEKETGK